MVIPFSAYFKPIGVVVLTGVLTGFMAAAFATDTAACCGGGGGGGGNSLENLRDRMVKKKTSSRRSHVRRSRHPGRVHYKKPRRKKVRKQWVKMKGGQVPEYTWGDPANKAFLPRWVKTKGGPVPEYKWGWKMPNGTFVPAPISGGAGGAGPDAQAHRRTPERFPAPGGTKHSAATGLPVLSSPAPQDSYGGSWRPPGYPVPGSPGVRSETARLAPPQKPTELSPYVVATAATINEAVGVALNGVTGNAAKAAQVAGFAHSTLNAAWKSKGVTSGNEKEFDEGVDNGVKSALNFAFSGLGAAGGGALGGPGGAVIGAYVGGKAGDAVHAGATEFGKIMSEDGFESSPGGPGPVGGINPPPVNR